MRHLQQLPPRFGAVLLAAAAALALAAAAQAQVQNSNADGHALDANNQIGSYGRNTASGQSPIQPGQFGNQIMNGNVTANKAFQGVVPQEDMAAFHGTLPSESLANFIRDSSGPTPISNGSSNQGTPWYGNSRFVPPPPGFSAAPNGGGYVPASTPLRTPGDLRLGDVFQSPLANAPLPNGLILPAPLDSFSQAPPSVASSPLSGLPQENPADVGEDSSMFSYTGLRPETAAERLGVDTADLQKMRQQVTEEQPNQNPAALTQTPMGTDALGAKPIDQALAGGPLTASVGTQANATPNSGQSYQNRVLVAPDQQSAAYAALHKRLDQLNAKLPPDVAAAQKYNAVEAQRRLEMQQAKPKVPAATRPAKSALEAAGIPALGQSGMQGLQGFPGAAPPSPADALARPAPLKIPSLADGMASTSLAGIMRKAEQLMKDKRFAAAVDQYDLAEQIAPNNPLVWIGRANAELGGSFYALAERHLRQAFFADPALLMGQYDLRLMLGDDRLEYLTKDLRALSEQQPLATTPDLLLAYISYNSGDERRALAYLEKSERRSTVKDPIYKLLRDHWSLPESTEPATLPALNK